MKIRPKTFECVLELVRQGYVLYVDNRGFRVTDFDDDEILWGSDYGWRWENNNTWQGFNDWYFKKEEQC